MNTKRRIIILISSVLIYLLLVLLYNNIVLNEKYIEAYVLKENIARGKILNEKEVEKVWIKNKNDINLESLILECDLDKYISKDDISKGSLLLKEDFIMNDEYITANENYEIISVKISNPEDIVSYQVEKNSIVNLYYTGKYEFANNILNNIEASYISSNGINSKLEGGFITVKLANNIKVINLFDKYGNVINKNLDIKSESNKIDTIMFELDKNMVMKINNLKNYGEFSISITK